VVIISLDDPDTKVRLGVLPWSIDQYSELLEKLGEYHVSSVAFDLIVENSPSALAAILKLPTLTINEGADREGRFRVALRRFRHVLFGYSFVNLREWPLERPPADVATSSRGLFSYEVATRPALRPPVSKRIEEIITGTSPISADEMHTYIPSATFVASIPQSWLYGVSGDEPTFAPVFPSAIKLEDAYMVPLPIALASSVLDKAPELTVRGDEVTALAIGERQVQVLPRRALIKISPTTPDVCSYGAGMLLRGPVRQFMREGDPAPSDFDGAIVLLALAGPEIRWPTGGRVPAAISDGLLTSGLVAGTMASFPTELELALYAGVLLLIALLPLHFVVGRKPLAIFFVSIATMSLVIVVAAGWEIADKIFRGKTFLWTDIWTGLTLAYLPILAIVLAHSAVTRSRFRRAFRHYMDPRVIEQLIESSKGLERSGELRRITVMFADLVNFTSVSESLSPAQVGDLLNTHLQAMTDVVIASGGIVDKLVGDSVMAFWGAPNTQPDACERAVRCALDMREAFLRLQQTDPLFKDLDLGVGIATGEAMVGNVGARQRFVYSANGDTVNFASRLEALTRQLNVRILCDEETASASEGVALFRDLGRARVKGKNNAVRIAQVIELDATDDSFRVRFNEAMAMIDGRRLLEARELLAALMRTTDDIATQMYSTLLQSIDGTEPASDELVLMFSTK
jgi:class 3 adenylate cyclase